MSARKGIYAITDEPCDGGLSPNAYVPKITAEVRMHYPPDTVTEEQVKGVLEASYNKAIIQMHEWFEDRRRRHEYMSGQAGLAVCPYHQKPGCTCWQNGENT